MSFLFHDPDQWETVVKTESYGNYLGIPLGSCSISYRQRLPEEVKEIKARKRREHEDCVLAEAAAIQARRAC